jgi:hypothetical protein
MVREGRSSRPREWRCSSRGMYPSSQKPGIAAGKKDPLLFCNLLREFNVVREQRRNVGNWSCCDFNDSCARLNSIHRKFIMMSVVEYALSTSLSPGRLVLFLRAQYIELRLKKVKKKSRGLSIHRACDAFVPEAQVLTLTDYCPSDFVMEAPYSAL